MYFHPLAKELLIAYDWPGNVRELENTIQRAILMSDDEQILAEHLELPNFDELLSNLADGAVNSKKADDPEFEVYQAKQLISRKKDDINQESGTEIAYISSKNVGNMESVERDHILKVLEQVGGNKTKAVEILGISDRALRYKLKSYREAGFDID
jgi:two-component system response regulator FlrC